MARRHWTVVVVSDDQTPVRQFRLTREAVRVLSALALFLVAGLASLGAAMLVGAGAGSADERLVAKNRLLEQELAEFHARIDTLQVSLEDLSRKDEYYRLLAGLEPLDQEVLSAGIGGPDADTLEGTALFAVDAGTGRQAFSMREQLGSLLRRANVLAESWDEAGETLNEKTARFAATPSIYPTRGYVSSTFTSARWHPILDRPRAHTGIDIVAPMGTPVIASANGRIASAGYQGQYGLTVEIDHGYGLLTRYAHLSRADVRVGQTVKRGERIGRVGQSGLAMGPHVHYEVLVNGEPANPRRFILESTVIPD